MNTKVMARNSPWITDSIPITNGGLQDTTTAKMMKIAAVCP